MPNELVNEGEEHLGMRLHLIVAPHRWLLSRATGRLASMPCLLVVLLCAAIAGGCARSGGPAGTLTAASSPTMPMVTARPPRCDKLDSTLNQVVNAPDPDAAAARSSLPYQAGRVEITIIVREN